MKRKLALCTTIACAMTLVACADVAISSAGTSESQTAVTSELSEVSSAASDPSAGVSESSDTAPFDLNDELFELLAGDNSLLKQMRQGSCYAEIPGRGTARVLYFEPFLDVQMLPSEEGTDTVWREGCGEGLQEENPFADDLPVIELTVMDKIDPLAPAVLEQDSLRQMFKTDELITYQMLCERLNQTPELDHTEEVYYNEPIPENFPLDNDPGEKITGGDWKADFSTESVRLTVNFIQTDNELVAYRAVLSEK